MANYYDISVFIGRFQPLHKGHLSVINKALEISKYLVILAGSANSPRSYRNPFSFEERKSTIFGSIPSHLRDRVQILPLEDSVYNDNQWIRNVQSQVSSAVWHFGYTSVPKITLIGHSKDASSYYLKMFPQWASTEVENFHSLDSTGIRKVYFSKDGDAWLNGESDNSSEDCFDRDTIIPSSVRDFLAKFIKTSDYARILEEYDFIAKYRKSWANAPYPPTFVTADCIVVQSGHVLLVRRGANPGKGLWAMPGGFVNQGELIKDAAIRELKEETGIKVPEPVLRGSIIAQDVFDDPNRSARGRTITHCFLIKLKDEVTLPKVKGSDDAEKAKWIPIADLKRQDFFEDHYCILNNMLAHI
jgi:bifunctional NMN adenylyltransferase/nudix hydrolase